MARINTNAEVFKQLTAVGIFRDNPATAAGDTTIDTAVAAGDVVIPVASETAFALNDIVRIGSGDTLEDNIVLSTAAGELTLKMPVAYDHAVGEVVHERVRITVGAPDENGITVRTNAELQEVATAISLKPYLRQVIGMTSELEWSLLNFSLENLAAAAGIPETAITGAGTSTSPQSLVVLDTVVTSDENVTMWAQGLRQDDTTYEVHGWSVEMDPSQEVNLRAGQPALIRMNGSAKGVRWMSPALP